MYTIHSRATENAIHEYKPQSLNMRLLEYVNKSHACNNVYLVIYNTNKERVAVVPPTGTHK